MDFKFNADMVLFIPFMELNVTTDEIRTVFECQEKLGIVDSIRFINKTGRQYKQAVICFQYWNNNEYTHNFQLQLHRVGGMARVERANRGHYWKIFIDKKCQQKMNSEKDKKTIHHLTLELYDLKDEYDIYKKLVNKYRASDYNADYEIEFHRDMREYMGCDEM